MRIRARCFCGHTTAMLDSDLERASLTIYCPNCITTVTEECTGLPQFEYNVLRTTTPARWWDDPERRTTCTSCNGRGYHLPVADGCDACGAIGYVRKEST